MNSITPDNKVLVVLDDHSSPEFLNVLKERNIQFDTKDMQSLKQTPEGTYDHVVAHHVVHGSLVQNVVYDYFNVLKPDGEIHILEPSNLSNFQSVKLFFIFAGFHGSSVGEFSGLVESHALKPSWSNEEPQKLQLKPKVKTDWSQLGQGDTNLINEEDLLDEEDLNKPNKVDDCEFGAEKKACKNCTCGRADDENQSTKPKLTMEMIENPGVNSSCGSCSLGDAFRCAGCPYKGLPSFKPGEKIVLSDDFDLDSLISN